MMKLSVITNMHYGRTIVIEKIGMLVTKPLTGEKLPHCHAKMSDVSKTCHCSMCT